MTEETKQNENLPTKQETSEPSKTPQTCCQGQEKKPGPSGKAITALVLGILSMICCGFLTGIPGIVLGKQEMNAIRDGKSDESGKSLATIGFILSIIGTAFSCLATIAYIAMIVLGVSMGVMENFQ